MICKKCGNILKDGARVCNVCGTVQYEANSPVAGPEAAHRREDIIGAQRSQLRDNPIPDPTISDRRRLRYYSNPRQLDTDTSSAVKSNARVYKVKRFMPNYSLIALLLLILFLILAILAFVLLNVTFQGQVILARFGCSTSAEALWAYGDELMNEGYIEKSIATYEAAYNQDPNISNIYDMLKKLAESYEAAGMTDQAEIIFNKMRELKPDQSYAYENIVRLMLAQGRDVQAADFLKLAYEKTQKVTFNTQRNDMMPHTPTASLGGGKYSSEKVLQLFSEEGYSIYYLLDKGDLPEDGILYTGPITLKEGYSGLRAVAVSNTLVSDELSVSYTITLPAPKAPYANLASGTYKSAQVKLKNMNDFSVTIYYTIDGTSPTANSPIYDGTPIVLPGGKSVHLKAVCVDQNNKVSNELDVEYEIEQKFPLYFRKEDVFSGFTLMETKRDPFVKKYGTPLKEEDIADDAIPDRCIRLVYSWGEARFFSSEKGFTLYYFESTSSSMQGPRNTKVGMTVEQVTSAFRDMGQKNNQDGSRSLYHDSSTGTGMITSPVDGKVQVEYIYYRDDGSRMILTYFAENNVVNKVSIGCTYQK